MINQFLLRSKNRQLTTSLVLHRVVTRAPFLWEDVQLKELEKAIKLLKANGRKFSTETDAIGSVILTFDDGNETDYLNVYPLLKQLKITAIFFVITKNIGSPGHLSEKQIKEMFNNGMKFGSHSHSHSNLLLLNKKELRDDLLLSKEILENIIKRPVTRLSIPFGKLNKLVYSTAVGLGYRFIFCSNHGLVSQGKIINRNSINKKHSAKSIAKIAYPSCLRQVIWKLEDKVKISIKFLLPHEFYIKFREFFLS